MKVLKARLFDLKLKEQQAKLDQIGGEKKDIAFGSQIRSYVLQPYQMIKDHRTKIEVGDVNRVLDGDLDAVHQDLPDAEGRRHARARPPDTTTTTERSVGDSAASRPSVAHPASAGCPAMNASVIGGARAVDRRVRRWPGPTGHEDDVAGRLEGRRRSRGRRAARCTCCMKSIQIGSAAVAPVSPLPIGFFSS